MLRRTCAWLGWVCGGVVHAHDCARLQSPLTLCFRAEEGDPVSRRRIGVGYAEDLVHSIRRRGCVAAGDAWVEVGGVARSAVVGDGV